MKYKIGDEVQVVNRGFTYPTYGPMFKKLGFKNKEDNTYRESEHSHLVVWTIFDKVAHPDGKKLLLALRDKDGVELLIDVKGVTPTLSIGVSKEDIKKLVEYFNRVCSMCEELDIYEHEELDESLQDKKGWVNKTFKSFQ